MNGLLAYYHESNPPAPVKKQVIVYKKRNPLTGIFEPVRVGPVPGKDLSGIFDTITGLFSGQLNLGAAFKSQIDSAQVKLQAELGNFLTLGQTISDLRQRANSQSNSSKPEVRQRAQAIAGKASALMDNFNGIRDGGLLTVQKFSDLKAAISKDPVFGFQSLSQMGTAAIAIYNKYKTQVGQLLSDSVNIATRAATLKKETSSLGSDVTSLESYSQGKGFQATVESFAGGVTSFTKPLAIVAVGGVMLYLLGPSLFARMRRS